MQKDLKYLFTKNEVATPESLMQNSISRIEREATISVKKGKLISSIVFSVSLFVAVLEGWNTISSISASGFSSYLSLVSSDLGSLNLVWKDLILSIAESIPVIGISLFLGSFALLLWSAKKFSSERTLSFSIINKIA